MAESIPINQPQDTPWAICFVPDARALTALGLLILALFYCIWRRLCRSRTKSEEYNPPLTTTTQPNYSSFDHTRPYPEVTEVEPNHTIIPINVKPMLEKRPSTVSYLSYAPSVWSLDNRILGQLNQLEQAQSYLFKSINILIDSQEELDDVEEFVGALSWGNDLSDISKMQYVH
ncbi:hypothetical protein K493DRAFT_314812 [Basidiobolus meristosporus CBS 931.73]|uniref:Uncharacterized protein n=1 Tax=Basidiobolus meristosporus CBS 931.73 TaxID=1314790 RepID=A0A1Y1YCV0_9FUNG|nr:hypothetical protein K493DRAFT_314812 [Basidiobolus meristosporus CBS 931.73]|eukprot:ORX95812.1 hypothetical protein K493DRAFT_314812 [Basidiobolus meristosporus CBS 931.73]